MLDSLLEKSKLSLQSTYLLNIKLPININIAILSFFNYRILNFFRFRHIFLIESFFLVYFIIILTHGV